ncbi:MAG: glycosyltransferase [Alphaproteobacteria bacterium]|nr:glycosyltransferase [Alphaproteobacteria bacterium]
MPASVTISIIEPRTADLTLGCLRSVLAELSGIDGQVVIVDNASGDGSAEEIAAWIDAQPANLPVKVMPSETHSGFAGGHNKGMVDPPVGRCLVLNSDAVLRLGFLKTTLEAAQANRDAGLSAGFPHDYPILYGLFLSHSAFDLHFPFVQK